MPSLDGEQKRGNSGVRDCIQSSSNDHESRIDTRRELPFANYGQFIEIESFGIAVRIHSEENLMIPSAD
jgi:hypothetical protein